MGNPNNEDAPGFTARSCGGSYYATLACPFDRATKALRFAAFACRAQNLRGFAQGVERALETLRVTGPKGCREDTIDCIVHQLEDLRDQCLTDLANMGRHFTSDQLNTLGLRPPRRG